jgi:predicted amino acid-binding ACT domain protein
MMMLRKTFSVIMLLSCEKKINEPGFYKDITSFMNSFQMAVDIREVGEKDMAEPPESKNRYMISISGADKAGIVNEFTSILFKAGANITDLETKSSEKVKPHAYYMLLETEFSSLAAAKKAQKSIASAAKKMKVHASINKVETEVL